MRLLVECKADPASRTIADALREAAEWTEQGLFEGSRVLAHGSFRLITIEEIHIENENLHQRLPPSLTDPEVVVFLSRHASESGKPTMSVHPIGNFADASYGGKPGTVVPSHPGWMAGLFHELEAHDPDGFDVTYEATHHGPYLEAPTLFYELGSTEGEWTDTDAGRVLAQSLLEATPRIQRPVLWVGGGHYCPQVNDAVRAGTIAPGHIIPGWAADEGVADATLEQALASIPACEGYVLQPDASTAEKEIAKRLDAWGINRVSL